MIPKQICENVITIGCDYRNPRGGIAQVLNSYSHLYETFNFIATTDSTNYINKLFIFVYAYIRLLFFFLIGKYSIVHIHGASYNSFKRKKLFIDLAYLFKRKIVYHIHGAEFEKFSNSNKANVETVFRKVDVVVALSDSWKIFFESQFPFLNVIIVNNIVPLPIKNDNNKSNVRICKLLFMGYLDHRKGVYDLLKCLKNDKDKFDGVLRLHIGGNGEADNVKNIINEYELYNIVCFEGWVSGLKKQELLLDADVFILPSYNEGLPISILEAMSYSLPIISTSVGGIPEIVEDDKNGFLIEPGNIQQMSSAIFKLLNDESLRKSMGYESYKRVLNHLPENVEKDLLCLYNKLI